MAIERIGTAANSQFMLAQMQKAQIAVDNSTRQVATGKVSDNYSGYADKTAAMEIARSAAAHAEANVATAQQAAARLDLQDSQLTQLASLMDDVRQAITKAAGEQDATSLMTQMEGYFGQAVEILNSKDANGYVFAGDRNQTAPVTVSTLADLAALPSVAQAFANGTVKSSVRVGDSQTVEVGLLASDLGTQLFSLFRQVAQFDSGVNGPFDAKTSAAQQSFLESKIQDATTVATQLNSQSAGNGIRYQMVQDTLTRLQATSLVHKTFVANIEDVDVAAALTRLNQTQMALQATFQVTATMNQISLLNYLR